MIVRAGIAVAAVWLLASPPARAQGQDRITTARLDAAVAAFGSESWQERRDAFYDLVEAGLGEKLNGRTPLMNDALAEWRRRLPNREEQLRGALIQLLSLENASLGAQKPLQEAANEYWGDLAAAVAQLKDRRAAVPLVALIERGNIATKGIAAIGVEALPLVLGRLRDPDQLVRQGVARTLVHMVESGVAAGAAAATIEQALLMLADDSQPWVRVSAIPGLARLSTSQGNAKLEQMAASDPFQRAIDSTPGGEFLVRDRARGAIDAKRPR